MAGTRPDPVCPTIDRGARRSLLRADTSPCVEEMLHTAEMDNLYREVVELTRSSLTRVAVSLELTELERAGQLAVVSRCLKCNQLRCNVRLSRPRFATDPGIPRVCLPPLVSPRSVAAVESKSAGTPTARMSHPLGRRKLSGTWKNSE